jgi:hypothetical protein
MLYGNSASPVISQLAIATYGFELIVTDINGAIAKDTVTFIVTGLFGNSASTRTLDENIASQSAAKMNIFPNPTKDQLSIEWTSEFTGDATLTVMDLSGRAVQRFKLNKSQALFTKQVNVQELKQGVYYLFIRMSNGRVVSRSFYKN